MEKENVNNEPMISITVKEYNSLLKDSQWLDCLNSAGVDNWSGIELAYHILNEDFLVE